jgi:hypothetical protein
VGTAAVAVVNGTIAVPRTKTVAATAARAEAALRGAKSGNMMFLLRVFGTPWDYSRTIKPTLQLPCQFAYFYLNHCFNLIIITRNDFEQN